MDGNDFGFFVQSMKVILTRPETMRMGSFGSLVVFKLMMTKRWGTKWKSRQWKGIVLQIYMWYVQFFFCWPQLVPVRSLKMLNGMKLSRWYRCNVGSGEKVKWPLKVTLSTWGCFLGRVWGSCSVLHEYKYQNWVFQDAGGIPELWQLDRRGIWVSSCCLHHLVYRI